MTAKKGHEIDLLIQKADSLRAGGRYAESLATAEEAVAAARELKDLYREIRATRFAAKALRMLGQKATAHTRLTWVLSTIADPARRAELEGADVPWEMASACMDWVDCARFRPEVTMAGLLKVLDEGEAYLQAVGKPGWRAGLLAERARVLDSSGRTAEAVEFAAEAVALKQKAPGAPGYTLATYRWSLGDLLRKLRRLDEAEGHYQAVLDDAASKPFDRKVAHEGLGRCALRRQDAATAHQQAAAASALAERMGDNALCSTLELLVEACLATGDLSAAQSAAERHLKAATRLGDRYDLYFAHRDALEVALAQRDAARARTHLAEAAPLARALDAQTGTAGYSGEVARYGARLTALEGTR